MELISIITPAFNAALFIPETIRCVLAQTYENWEMIIVDDGSTDNTAEIIKPFLSDPRIKYYYQNNGKQGKARNLALSKVNGEYVAFLDADDLWTSDKLQKQISKIKEVNADVLYSQGWAFNTKYGYNDISRLKKRKVLVGNLNNYDFLLKLLEKNEIPILSVLAKTSVIKKVGQFTECKKIQNAEDYHLWLKIADSGYVFYGMHEELFYYRVHPSQITSLDTYASIESFYAIKSYNFKSINERQKKKYLFKFLNSALKRQIDLGLNNYYFKILKLYRTELNRPLLFIILYSLSILGTRALKIFSYRYLN